MKRKACLVAILVYTLNVFSQNVLITEVSGNEQGYGPNEPSISMDPNNTDILVAGTILNNYHFSRDGGRTWETDQLSSPYGVWGDPVIDVDSEGNFYYFHLSNTGREGWLDRIVCQKSTDNGATWTEGTFVGLNGTKDQDKQWSVIDRANDNIYLTWTQFDKYNDNDPSCASVILFSKSLDGGLTWSEPRKINTFNGDCLDGDNTVEGAVPAVGPNGEIYVSWAGPRGVVFNRSLDQGETWLEEEIVIDPMPDGWDLEISGIDRANGLPIIKCDLSGGANHGNIYVNWSDQRNGMLDTEIWLSSSADGGTSWSAPVKVNNDDSGKQQFFSWMDIDQTNGNLHFVFYDRRNHSGDWTDVYLAFSNDGGATFMNRKISESPFLPNKDIFFGDYTNIVAHDDVVRPVWTRLHEGKLSVWTDVSTFDETLGTHINTNRDEFESKVYPNPLVDENNYVSFKLRGSSIVSIEIFDEHGKFVHTVLDNHEMGYGIYSIPVDLTELNLQTGLYYIRLKMNGKSKTMKTLIIK